MAKQQKVNHKGRNPNKRQANPFISGEKLWHDKEDYKSVKKRVEADGKSEHDGWRKPKGPLGR